MKEFNNEKQRTALVGFYNCTVDDSQCINDQQLSPVALIIPIALPRITYLNSMQNYKTAICSQVKLMPNNNQVLYIYQ